MEISELAEKNIRLLYILVNTVRRLRKEGIDIDNKEWQDWVENCIEELIEQEKEE